MQMTDKPGYGLDTMWRMRVPADLVPRMHAHARQRGLSSSAWIRFLIISAMEAENRDGLDHREAA